MHAHDWWSYVGPRLFFSECMHADLYALATVRKKGYINIMVLSGLALSLLILVVGPHHGGKKIRLTGIS